MTDETNHRIQVFGDPAAPAPRCAPVARVERPTWSGRREALVVRATCDQPCTLRVRAAIGAGGAGMYAVKGTVRLRAEERGRLILPVSDAAAERIQGALRAGARVVARTRTTASGFGGRAKPVARNARLRR